jgi:hypothetical protein
MWNLFKSWRCGEPVTVDDPWGYGNSLEWATSCPPPRHNFTQLPRIRSERPALELQPTHGGAEPTSAATTPRCTADAIREWQLFLRRISPSVSSRTGRSAPPFRRQYPPVPVTAAKALKETFGCDGQRGPRPTSISPMYLVVRAQRGRNVDGVMGSDHLSSGRPGSSGLHVCGPALHTGRPREPAARNSSQRLGLSGRRRGGAQTRSCGLSRWKVVEPQNILIAFGKGICYNGGAVDPYAAQSPTITSSQPSCN